MDFRRLLQEERRRARESAGQSSQVATYAASVELSTTHASAAKVGESSAAVEKHDDVMSCWRQREPLALEKYQVPGIKTVYYIPEWLSQEEEDAILGRVYGADPSAWVQLKLRRLQMYGGEVKTPFYPEPMPQWLQQIAQSLVANEVFAPGTLPNHALINEYGVGEGILPHEDGPAYFPFVAIASTGADAFVQFTPHRDHAHDASLQEVRFAVRRRSLLLFTDEAYTRYLHSIDGIEAGKRVSLTIRHVNVHDKTP